MPFYDYACKNEKCEDSNKPVEKFHKIQDDPKYVCEKCKSEMKRLISKVNISFGFTEKMSRQATKKNSDLRVNAIQKELAGHGELVPNFQGDEFNSWEDAKKAAARAEISDEETGTKRKLTEQELATYDKKIEKVQKEKKVAVEKLEALKNTPS